MQKFAPLHHIYLCISQQVFMAELVVGDCRFTWSLLCYFCSFTSLELHRCAPAGSLPMLRVAPNQVARPPRPATGLLEHLPPLKTQRPWNSFAMPHSSGKLLLSP